MVGDDFFGIKFFDSCAMHCLHFASKELTVL